MTCPDGRRRAPFHGSPARAQLMVGPAHMLRGRLLDMQPGCSAAYLLLFPRHRAAARRPQQVLARARLTDAPAAKCPGCRKRDSDTVQATLRSRPASNSPLDLVRT